MVKTTFKITIVSVDCYNQFFLQFHKVYDKYYQYILLLLKSKGEHQYELMDSVAAKFHEEPGVFKLMVCTNWKITIY